MHQGELNILSKDSREYIEQEWRGVEVMFKRMRNLTVVTFASGAITGPAVGKVVYNLPLLLATDVLCQTLKFARDESLFSSNKNSLGKLVQDSENILQWIDWTSIWEAVDRRNKIAHDGELFDSKLCISSISSIRDQLKSWGLIQNE